jgi:serine/threonine protein kinase
MGVIYHARQTSMDRLVAVKMLKPDFHSRKQDHRNKFLAEAVITAELSHPNIVPIYDVGRDQNDAFFYAMTNVTGRSWLDTIHAWSVADNLKIWMNVADAVAFAHSRGVIHRDLKPENVMLGTYGEVFVMDWGLAIPTERFSKRQHIFLDNGIGGTPAYMAPEMAIGPASRIGPHSDVYLLGAILFEIVTGKPPHAGEDAMKCLMAAVQNEIVSVHETGELLEIAYKAMATHPDDRHQGVQELQTAVREHMVHSESITLAAIAEKHLERAQHYDSDEEYAKALFGFEESIRLWDRNKWAINNLGAARLAYAHHAMSKENFDLAYSLLDEHDLAHQKLRADIANTIKQRSAPQKNPKRMQWGGRALIAFLFIAVCAAFVWVNNERMKMAEMLKRAVEEERLPRGDE